MTQPADPPKPSEPYEVFGRKDPLNLESRFYPEGMGARYPYGFSTGAEPGPGNHSFPPLCPIILFYGDEYEVTAGGLIIPEKCAIAFGFGADPYSVAFGFNLGGAIGHFVSNAVKTAGREVGHVTGSIQTAAGKVSKAVKKVPVVGGPLSAVFDASYHGTFGLVNMTVAVAQGHRVDKAVMEQLHDAVKDFKQVGPYAQMVIGMVPGVGQGVSAAMSAGLALANGQPIAEVLKAGALGAIPGGPLVQSAVRASVETIQHVAKGEKLDLASITQTAGGVAAGALGLPKAANDALMAGIATTGSIVKGQPLDKALTDGAVHALPIPDSAKKAMTEATALTLDIAHGKRVDRALMARVDGVVGMLPTNAPLRQSLLAGVHAVRDIGQSKDAEHIMMSALQSGVGDQLVSLGAGQLPKNVRDGLKTGIALGTGAVHQEHTAAQLIHIAPGKLAETGIQMAKASPVFGEARKIAASKGGSKGFDLATGILSHQAGIFHLSTVRNMLQSPHDKMGFDIAMATRIGTVAHPKPKAIQSPAAHAGHAITLGMQTYVPERKAAIMQTIQGHPSAAVGATQAVKEVALNRDSLVEKILHALHLR
jgi:hypothetical protein